MRYSIHLLMVLFIACGCNEKSAPADTATTGHIRISVDEAFYPIIDAELAAFHSFYKYASVEPVYVSEDEAIKKLLDDSVRIAVVSRELSENEVAVFEQEKLRMRVLKISTDAVALIAHPENPVSSLTIQQLSKIFSGETQWNEIFQSADTNKILIVFDHSGSGTARFIREKFNTSLPENSYAVKNHSDVIQYVSENPNALGIIGVNWISDSDDSDAQEFSNKINVLRIAVDSMDLPGKQPYQAYIADSSYPLTRSIYIISREARNGLGTGFTAFVASDKGQRIILKSGLVPATMPVRIIGLKNE